jgi:hypothetical protein
MCGFVEELIVRLRCVEVCGCEVVRLLSLT